MTADFRPSTPEAANQAAWQLTLAASRLAPRLAQQGGDAAFAADAADGLRHVDDEAHAVLVWRAGDGWQSRLPSGDPRADLVDLYLPICSATMARPIAIGHLGQSLDGFIATPSGDSQYVTGEQNIVHLHALRGLSDAVVVGAGTVAADDPQLTTRLVPGPHPVRVVFDPVRRLRGGYRLFSDTTAPTLYVCDRSRVAPGETHVGHATIVGVDMPTPPAAMRALLAALHERGASRVFIEGGGVTVSRFLEAGLLDRLHIAVAPMLIGDGRPAIRLEARERLRDCRRPRCRVFRMGGDVLFDCDLRADADPSGASVPVSRII